VQRLSGLDAVFLYMETASSHMHVAGTAVFDPSTASDPYSFERVRELIGQRLHLVPPFRRRLATVPFGLHHPVWVDDPDFDLEYHVRRAALPSPGGDNELARLAADVCARPLDRTRPLWEMYVVEGLRDGHIATVTKVHHAAIDGISGAEITVALLDLQPEPTRYDPPEWKPERVPSDLEMLAYAGRSLLRQPPRLVRTLWRTAGAALNLRPGTRTGARPPDLRPPPTPFSAPRTSMNVALSPHRQIAFAELSLDEVKGVKRRLGGTVNDVVLAVCAGALRRYFEARREPVDADLVAMVPISVRAEEQRSDLGNKVSSMLVSLGTTIADPVERLATISAGTRGAKEQHRAIGAETLTDWAEFAAPAVAALAARLYSRTKLADRHRPFFNLTISNVPGPPFPLYSFGARLVANYPLGPIFDGGALNITVMSYMGSMCFGLVACPEAVDDVWSIAAALVDSLDELKKAAGV